MDFSILYLPFILDSQTIFKFENSFSENFAFLNELSKSNEILSIGCLPVIASIKNVISFGVFAKHPGVVKIGISKF